MTSLAQIRAMAPADAAAGHDVEIVATATFVHAGWNSLFVQDATAGAFVFSTEATDVPKAAMHPGDLLEITGQTAPGDFAPMLAATRIRVKRAGKLPPPEWASLDRIASGDLDCELVEVRGVVRSVQRDEDIVRLEVAMPRDRYVVLMEGSGALPAGLGVNAQVHLTAVVGSKFNTRRQMTGIYFLIPTPAQVEVERAAPNDPFALPLEAARDVLSFEGRRRVGLMTRLHGMVLASQGPWLYLRDDTGAVQVYGSKAGLARAGDVVDVVGFPRADGFTPMLEDAQVRRVGTKHLPQPMDIVDASTVQSDRDGELVRVHGRVVRSYATPNDSVLVVEAGAETFTAHLDSSVVTVIRPASARQRRRADRRGRDDDGAAREWHGRSLQDDSRRPGVGPRGRHHRPGSRRNVPPGRSAAWSRRRRSRCSGRSRCAAACASRRASCAWRRTRPNPPAAPRASSWPT